MRRSIAPALLALFSVLAFACSGGDSAEPAGGSAGGGAPAGAGLPEQMGQTSDSGLVIIHLVEGTGASPGPTDVVRVHYHGTFPDGTVFDSSVERGQPARFPLNRVIPCWTEGVQKMKVGGKAKLECPPKIAYGEAGAPPKIPPNSTLYFQVELLAVE